MKSTTFFRIIFLFIVLSSIGLVGCFTLPERDIEGEKLISLYNSRMEETQRLSPLETLHVQVAGLAENEYHSLTVVSPDSTVISKVEAKSNEYGVIEITPLWYDVGLKNPDNTHSSPWVDKTTSLVINTFYVKVKSLENDNTNFQQEMFIVYGTSDIEAKPRPVVTACYIPNGDAVSADNCHLENAFEETGSRDADGTLNAKTRVWVQAHSIPFRIAGTTTEVETVDVYILPYTGITLEEGDDLTENFVVRKQDVAVVLGDDSRTKKLEPVLLWDLNSQTLINPGEGNSAFRVVLDVNQDGVFDIGLDVDGDNVTDQYIDGVDGNSIAGFVVQNTPANDLIYSIRDGSGRKVNTLPEESAVDNTTDLYLTVDNVPTDNPSVNIYIIDSIGLADQESLVGRELRDGGDVVDLIKKDVTEDTSSDVRFLPFVDNVRLINTGNNNNYTYSTDISSDTLLDIVVDIDSDGNFDSSSDFFIDNAIHIMAVPVTVEAETCSDENCTIKTQLFDESNTPNGITHVYLTVDISGSVIGNYTAYVVKNKEWQSGDYISGELFSATGEESIVLDLWDLDGNVKVVNPPADDNIYDIVIDTNQDGIFNSNDVVTSIVIRDLNWNALPKVNYANIASGGYYKHVTAHWSYRTSDMDYRDTFKANGQDTKGIWDRRIWRYSRGIKAAWNPYFKWWGNRDHSDLIEGLYYRQLVDVYIVDATTVDLANWQTLELKNSLDVTGRKKTLPIQYSCYNGAGQQLIWPAPMKVGKYYVIVDVNRDGSITEGKDIIDAVNANGRTIKEDSSIVGFSVVR